MVFILRMVSCDIPAACATFSRVSIGGSADFFGSAPPASRCRRFASAANNGFSCNAAWPLMYSGMFRLPNVRILGRAVGVFLRAVGKCSRRVRAGRVWLYVASCRPSYGLF